MDIFENMVEKPCGRSTWCSKILVNRYSKTSVWSDQACPDMSKYECWLFNELRNFQRLINVEFVFTSILRPFELKKMIIVQRSLWHDPYKRHLHSFGARVLLLNRRSVMDRTGEPNSDRRFETSSTLLALSHEVVVKKFLSDRLKSHGWSLEIWCN